MRNIMQRRTKIFGAALAVFAIAGCATLGALGGFKQPVVNFKDLRVRGLGLTGGSLDVGGHSMVVPREQAGPGG